MPGIESDGYVLRTIWAGFRQNYLEHELEIIAHLFRDRPAPREIRLIGIEEKIDVCMVYLLGADKPPIPEWPEGFRFVAMSKLSDLGTIVTEALQLFKITPLEIRLIKSQTDIYEMYVKPRVLVASLDATGGSDAAERSSAGTSNQVG